mgnify:CR=1 FL=1
MTYSLLMRVLAGLGINVLFALGAYRSSSVTRGGAVAGLAVGVTLFAAGGFLFWMPMAGFFLSSTLLSRYKERHKADAAMLHEKHAVRDALQVLANGAPGAFWGLLYLFFPVPEVTIGAAASFGAANADTWAGEVGMLSHRRPLLIIDGKPVERGRSGGITPLGLGASLGGALFIAVLFLLLALFHPLFFPGVSAAELCLFAAIAAAGGFLGSLIDSVLGATLQVQYTDYRTGAFTERPVSPEGPNTRARGLPFINNDAVNFISFLLAGAVSVGILILARG